MCGIAGIVYRDPQHSVLLDELKPMLDRIIHRGPDDWGYHIDGSVGFGMRRLSIIDLATGHQPIHNEDSTVWTVFNGEIYNFRDLRPILESKGHRFTTNSDTEVIVHLWEEYGPGFVEHLRGMFAIALWDLRTRRFVLVRDRLGIKPLYYCENDQGLFFGSELKSLIAHSAVGREIDYAALREYLELMYIPAPRTVFTNVRKLHPGHCAIWCDGQLRIERYWDSVPDPISIEFDDAVEQLRDELLRAVRMRLIADVPLGVFLSGGIDSSAVVAMMARQMNEPVKTFSIGFDYAPYNELPHARKVAEHLGTGHHEEIVRPDAIGLLPKLVWHYDEPFADSSAIPTYYVSRLARRHVTVALTGDGGDELFAGYKHYRWLQKYATFDRLMGPLRHPLFSAAARLPVPLRYREILRRLSKPLPDITREALGAFTTEFMNTVAPNPPIGKEYAESFSNDDLWKRVPNGSFVDRVMYADQKTYLVDDILTKVDRASMAVSLEARVPLLDHRVVELANRLPLNTKLRDGRISKHILKEIIRPWMPDGFDTERKQGFGVPLVHWFRTDLRDYLYDRLLSSKSRERGLFDMAGVEQIIDEHVSGRMQLMDELWTLLFLEEWFTQFVDGEPSASSPTFEG